MNTGRKRNTGQQAEIRVAYHPANIEVGDDPGRNYRRRFDYRLLRVYLAFAQAPPIPMGVCMLRPVSWLQYVAVG